MPKNLELEVANFVCRFSDKEFLNDRLNDVIFPAFKSDAKRISRGSEYFLINQNLVFLGAKEDFNSLGICFQFVKNTTLKRHQVYTESGEIILDEQEIRTAPTSLGILLLNSHRLLFVRQVPFAPTLQQFGSTIKERINNVVSQRQQLLLLKNSSLKKDQLDIAEPIPEININPIPSKEGLKRFINRFEKLTTLKVELIPINNEIENDGFFDEVRDKKDDVGSSKTTVSHTNPNGLKKEGCLRHAEAAKQGNLKVSMKGKDKNGDDLKGDNEDFSVRASLGIDKLDNKDGFKIMYSKYSNLISDDILSVGSPHFDYVEKLRAEFKLF